MVDLRPILLVEDNVNDLELTLSALERCDVHNRVVVARDGREALDHLYRHPDNEEPLNPAVVLLDLKLPKLDGLDVLATLKGDPERRQIPIVVFTSSREPSDVARSYELGVNAYVVKPVSFTAFLKAIREMSGFWTNLNKPFPRSSGTPLARRARGASTPPQDTIEIYQFEVFASATGRMVSSQRWGTIAGINSVRGVVIPDTRRVVANDPDIFERPGITKSDFLPGDE